MTTDPALGVTKLVVHWHDHSIVSVLVSFKLLRRAQFEAIF